MILKIIILCNLFSFRIVKGRLHYLTVKSHTSQVAYDRLMFEHVNMIEDGKEEFDLPTISNPEAEESIPHIELPHDSLVARLKLEVSFVPEKMSLSQRVMFESIVHAFLQEKIALSSPHSISIKEVHVIDENISDAPNEMHEVQDDEMFALDVYLKIHGKEMEESGMNITTFNKLSFETIRNYEEFLARDIHLLSHKDEYFQHVYEISTYNALELNSLQSKFNSNELNHPLQAPTRVAMILGISAICAGSFGLLGLLSYLFFSLRSVSLQVISIIAYCILDRFYVTRLVNCTNLTSQLTHDYIIK